jgi:hypothetical protein
MVEHGNAVLRSRLCLGRDCNALFFICSHCDRGQRYCGKNCSTAARRRQHREANRRYQSSPEGKRDHLDRQYNYLQRQSQAELTDQGSHSVIPPALSECGEKIGVPAAEIVAALSVRPQSTTGQRLCCCICGRPGWFVNPFPRTSQRR